MKKKKIELNFYINYNDEIKEIAYTFNNDFPSSFFEDSPSGSYNAYFGDIVAFMNCFVIFLDNASGGAGEIIGHVNDLSINDLMALIGNSETVNLELVLKTEKPDTSKIAEINKKIKSKSRNWKTVKILKRLKSLKRYRIVKRLK